MVHLTISEGLKTRKTGLILYKYFSELLRFYDGEKTLKSSLNTMFNSLILYTNAWHEHQSSC